MKRSIMLVVVIGLILVSCSNPEERNIIKQSLETYEVEKITAENVAGDFVFQLASEKKAYEDGADVELYGEITYIGDKSEVIIHHSSSAILFSLEEKVRGYNIGFGVNDIGLSTTLRKGEPYREKYKKSGGYAENEPKDYVKFMESFLNEESFPIGYYVVDGETDFYLEEQGQVNIKATIDFKVID